MPISELLLQRINDNDPTLTIASISHNTLGDAEVIILSEAIKANIFLQSINLSANKINDAGAKALSEALKTNTFLQSIDLSSNNFALAGVLALSEALKINQSLRSFYLTYSRIDDDGIKALSEGLKANKSLQSVDLSYNAISAFRVRALSDVFKTNRSLRSINLSYNKISDDGVKALCEVLKNNRSLHFLVLEKNDIGTAGAMALSETLKTNKSLKFIILRNNRIHEEGARVLSHALKTNTTLQSIDLSINWICDAGARMLAETLQTNASLQSINLSHIHIGIEGATLLSEALKMNTTLQTIDLSFNQIGNIGVTALSEALKTNTSLQSINLSTTQIGIEGTTILSEALKINTSLRTIDLSHNQIGNVGVTALSEALKTNTSLESINFSENDIHDAGIKTLSKALSQNFTLLEIKGLDKHPSIRPYLERNRAIKKILSDFIENPVLGLDSDGIAKSVKELQALGPNSSHPSDDSHQQEIERLLNALGRLAALDDNGDILNGLFPSFSHANLQTVADLAIGQFFSGEIAKKFTTPSQEKARCQLILHGLRNQLHRPELHMFAYIALFKLVNPSSKKFQWVSINALIKNTALLSHQNIVAIGAMALAQCKNQEEIELLQMVMSQKGYHPTILHYLCQSPAFLSAFKQNYPDKHSFILIEDCILGSSQNLVVDIPRNISAVTAELKTDCIMAMKQLALNPMDVNMQLKVIKRHVLDVINGPIVPLYHVFAKASHFGCFFKPTGFTLKHALDVTNTDLYATL